MRIPFDEIFSWESIVAAPAAPQFIDSSILLVPPPQPAIGALWRRILAALLDSALVYVVVTATAIPFFEPLSRLGGWGRAVGFCLALPYFAFLNSSIAGGRTLGKKLFRLRVVARNGQPISPVKSIARYTVLSLPFFLNKLTLPNSKTPSFIADLLMVFVFGSGFVLIYLVVFNRHTRQGPHDLLVRTYVVDAKGSGCVNSKPIWRGHWLIIAVFLGTGTLTSMWLQNKVEKTIDLAPLMADSKMVEDMPDVQAAIVSDGTTWYFETHEKKTNYDVRVIWSGTAYRKAQLANTIADQILQRHPEIKSRDYLRIEVVRGYDLGITHDEETQSFEDTPANWQKKLHGTPQK